MGVVLPHRCYNTFIQINPMTASELNFDSLNQDFNILKSEDALSIELTKLKTLGRHRCNKVPGVDFIEWRILPKSNILSHSQAKELGIPCQTRVGQALFLETIKTINQNILEEGWDYYTFAPAVSVIDEEFCNLHKIEYPLIVDGERKDWIVRDGNNRFETDWELFPAAVIAGDDYDLRRYGAMANAPDNKTMKNDCTEKDVIVMIQEGFECGKIAKTEDAVFEELKKNYTEVQKKNRRLFVAKILEQSGEKVSVEPFTIKKAEEHIEKHMKISMGEDVNCIRTCYGFGREPDETRKLISIWTDAVRYPSLTHECYIFQEQGKGVSVEPNEENMADKRKKTTQKITYDFIHDFVLPTADAYRKGKYGAIIVKHLSQLNYHEKQNELQ